jgi:hypothetical protein
MSRFSKAGLIKYLSDRAEVMRAKHGLDSAKGLEQLGNKFSENHIDRAFAYGDLLCTLELLALYKTGSLTKAKALADLDERFDKTQEKYGFDLNNGTAQLRKGKFANFEASTAYGYLRTCESFATWIDSGSIFR